MKKSLFCALAFASFLFLASCGDSKNAESDVENDEMEMVESSTESSDMDFDVNTDDYAEAMENASEEYGKAVKEWSEEYGKAMKEYGDEYEKAMKEAAKELEDIDF